MTKCELCGDDFHQEPDIRKDQFGLYCPGAGADQGARDHYVQAVMEGYLNLLTEIENYKDTIEDRKRLWYARERSEVSQDELQADCDTRTAEVAEYVPLEPQEFILDLSEMDIEPEHLQVPGEVPQRRPGLIEVKDQDYTKPEDAALFVDPPQGPQPWPWPDYPDHFPTKEH